MGLIYSYHIQLPYNLTPREDKILRRFYSRIHKFNMLKENIQYKTYNLILFFCDYDIELNYYVEFSKRLVGNSNIIYLFKNKDKQNMILNNEVLNSEISVLKNILLVDYGIELRINKKILLSEKSNFNIISSNYIYIYNILSATLILNPMLDTYNINLFNIFFNTNKSKVYIVYTIDNNINNDDINKITIPINNIIYTKTISSHDIYNIGGIDNYNQSIKWDEFVDIINNIILII